MPSPKKKKRKLPKHRIPKEHYLKLRDGGAIGGKQGEKGYDRKRETKVEIEE